jgi:hypothetical protein
MLGLVKVIPVNGLEIASDSILLTGMGIGSYIMNIYQKSGRATVQPSEARSAKKMRRFFPSVIYTLNSDSKSHYIYYHLPSDDKYFCSTSEKENDYVHTKQSITSLRESSSVIAIR